MTVEEAVIQKLRGLSPERKQEVLDFVEFLEARSLSLQHREAKSALELAGDLIGSLEGGPGDLATNPEHMKGYGRD